MPKGRYEFRANGDQSFRSCVCALGIFILICTLLIVISVSLFKSKLEEEPEIPTTRPPITRTYSRIGGGPKSGLEGAKDDETSSTEVSSTVRSTHSVKLITPKPISTTRSSTTSSTSTTTTTTTTTTTPSTTTTTTSHVLPSNTTALPVLVSRHDAKTTSTTTETHLSTTRNSTGEIEHSGKVRFLPPLPETTTMPETTSIESDRGSTIAIVSLPTLPTSHFAKASLDKNDSTTAPLSETTTFPETTSMEPETGSTAARGFLSSSALPIPYATNRSDVDSDSSTAPLSETTTIPDTTSIERETGSTAGGVLSSSALPLTYATSRSVVDSDPTAVVGTTAASPETTVRPEAPTTIITSSHEREIIAEVTVPTPESVNSTEDADTYKELPEGECGSFECRRLAARTLSLMALNDSVQPCADFYTYACGGLRTDPFLLPHDYSADVWERIGDQANNISGDRPESYRKFKKFLDSCEERNIDEHLWKDIVNEELNDIGFLDKSFSHIFQQLIERDSPFLFDVQLEVQDAEGEETDPRFTLRIVPANLIETSFEISNNELNKCETNAKLNVKNLRDTYKIISDCTVIVGQNDTLEVAQKALAVLNRTDAENIRHALIDLETFINLTNRMNVGKEAEHQFKLQTREYHKIILTDLNKELSHKSSSRSLLEWDILIGSLVKEHTKDLDHIYVYDIDYLERVSNIFSEIDETVLREALQAAFVAGRWRVLRAGAGDAGAHACVRRAAALLRDAAASLYLDSFAERDLKVLHDAASKIATVTKDFLVHEVETNGSWMGAGWKLVKDKIYNMRTQLPNPLDLIDITNKTLLDAQYDDVDIDQTNYLNNTFNLMRFRRRRMYDHINKGPAESVWTHFLPVFDVRGRSIYPLNLNVIPLGMLAKPFFHPDYPPYLLYAGLGFAIAHEMAHHFDWTGIKYESNGRKGNSLVNYALEQPVLGSAAFTDIVYGERVNYELESFPASSKMSADLSPKDNEYFADLMGVHMAYGTYQSRYIRNDSLPFVKNVTMKQAFFIHLAQSFCTRAPLKNMVLDLFNDIHFPPPFRVAKLARTFDFGEAFSCTGETRTLHFPYFEADLESVPGS